MPLVFQFGSNCTKGRLNGPNRLNGRAEDLGRAETTGEYDIAFDVYSETNGCAASDHVPIPAQKAWGVLFKLSEKGLEKLKESEGSPLRNQVDPRPRPRWRGARCKHVPSQTGQVPQRPLDKL